jgi:hypothetical protein
MFGRIIPAPLLMPVMVTARPLISRRREAALATVSVVMMACAAACQLSAARSAMHRRKSGKQPVDRQGFEDHSGRKGQHLPVVDRQQLAECSTGLYRRPASPARRCRHWRRRY